jgi:hypothetical protein
MHFKIPVRDGARIKYKLMGFMVYFYLRKINTCYCMTCFFLHGKKDDFAGMRMYMHIH